MGRKARFNADNVVGVIFLSGSKYKVLQNSDYPTKVDLVNLDKGEDNKDSMVRNWGSKALVAANLNCKSWIAIEEPQLYQIF